MIDLGRTYQDVVTGFRGVAIGHVRYLPGCNQALLTPKVGDDGRLIESQWFDDQQLRLEGDDNELPVLQSAGANPGSDQPVPNRIVTESFGFSEGGRPRRMTRSSSITSASANSRSVHSGASSGSTHRLRESLAFIGLRSPDGHDAVLCAARRPDGQRPGWTPVPRPWP